MTLKDVRAAIITHGYRTGSNYIASVFGNNDLGIAAEYFNRGFDARLTGMGAMARREMALREIAGNVVGQVFSAKLPLQDFLVLAHCMGWSADPIGNLRDAFGAATFLHLYREDIFMQAVSFWRARMSGEWYRYDTGEMAPAAPEYDYAGIAESYAYLCRERDFWRDLYARAKLTPLILSYEALDADPCAIEQVIDSVKHDLKLPKRQTTIATGNIRQRDDVSMRYRDRFLNEALASYLPLEALY